MFDADLAEQEPIGSLANDEALKRTMNSLAQTLTLELRARISSLQEENDRLGVALDEQRMQNSQLMRERELGKWTVTAQDLALQDELNQTRVREADLLLAYDELRHRIDSIDAIIETDPDLMEFFNSMSQVPSKSSSLGRCHVAVNTSPMLMMKTMNRRQNRSHQRKQSEESNSSGQESPVSDSGCSLASSSHPGATSVPTDEPLAARRELRKAHTMSMFNPAIIGYPPLVADAPSAPSTMLIEQTIVTPKSRPLLGRMRKIQESMRISLNQLVYSNNTGRTSADLGHSNGPLQGPDFRLQLLAVRKGEARALVLMRTQQMELHKVEARCEKMKRYVGKLESMLEVKQAELDEANNKERDLRSDIRRLERKLFNQEAFHKECEVMQQIRELELAGKVADLTLKLSQKDNEFEHEMSRAQILNCSIGEDDCCEDHDRDQQEDDEDARTEAALSSNELLSYEIKQ